MSRPIARVWALAIVVLLAGVDTSTAAEALAIHGVVTNDRGGMAGVLVSAKAVGDGSTPVATTTAGDGAFRLEGVSAGPYYITFTWADRLVAARAVVVDAVNGLALDVTITVDGDAEAVADPFHQRSTVVVTATRSSGEIDRTPLSASVITATELEARPLRNVDQQLTLTEGVYVQRFQGTSATDSTVAVRGFSGAARTLVLLDGQPMNDAYANSVNWTGLPIGEIESIEVARGPFSSLYGGNALGGVINIRTRPVDRRQFTAMVEGGTYGTGHGSVRYADRVKGRLALSVGLEGLWTSGYNSRVFTATPGAGTGVPVTGAVMSQSTAGARVAIIGEGGTNWLRQRAVRARGEYTLGTSSVASVQYLRMDYRFQYVGYNSYLRDANGQVVDSGAVVFDDNGVSRRLAITPNNFLQGPGEQHSNYYSGSVQHALKGGAALRVDAGFYDIPLYEFRSLGTGNTLTSGPGSLSAGIRRTGHANGSWSSQIARRHAVTVGGEVRHEMAQNRTFGLSNWTVRDARLGQTYFAQGRSNNESAYVQDQVAVTARLSVVAGARFDRWRGYDGVSDTFNPLSPRTAYPARVNQSINGKIALGYALPFDWNIRLSAGTAFRNPNVFELYATSVTGGATILAANPSLVPENVRSWEAGVRKRFRDWTSLDLAYYEDHVRNLVYRQTDLRVDPSGNYRINQNAGSARTRGFEAVVRQQIAAGWQVRATYSHSSAIVTDNPGNPAIVGKYVTTVPQNMASGQLLAVKGKMLGSLGGRYVGRLYSTDTNADVVKGVPGSYSPYFTMDATVAYNVHPKLQLRINSENLLDRRYFIFYRSPGRMVFGGLRLTL